MMINVEQLSTFLDTLSFQWFPSSGMMIESMAGKSAATFAHCYDATPFQFSEEDPAIDHFGELLVKGELLSTLVL